MNVNGYTILIVLAAVFCLLQALLPLRPPPTPPVRPLPHFGYLAAVCLIVALFLIRRFAA